MMRVRALPVRFELLLPLLLLLLAGCYAGSRPSAAGLGLQPSDSPPINVEQSNYHSLMGEIALERKKYSAAAREYQKAAEMSPDEHVAARASQVAAIYGTRDQAAATARRWVRLNPESQEARTALIQSLVQLRDGEAVLPELRSVLEADPDQLERRFDQIERWLSISEDAAFATRIMQALVSEYKDSPRAHLGLARLALTAHNYKLAQAHVEEALRLDEESIEAKMLHARTLVIVGREAEGLAQARERLTESSDPGPQLEYALLLLATDEEEMARARLTQILAEHPSEPRALRALGLLELQAGELSAAKDHFSELLSTGAFPDEAIYYLAAIYERQEDFPRALRFYGRVTAGPNAVNAQARVARILNRLGDEESGLRHLEAFGDTFPEHQISTVLARGQLLVELNEHERALDLYRKASEDRPDEDRLLYAEAFLLEQLDRVDEAIAVLRELVRRWPQDPTALNALGYTLTDRTQRHREAYRYIKQALEMSPDNAAIMDSMGWVLFHRGMHSQALEYLRRAYDLEADPEIAAHLGEALWTTGDKAAAREVWDKALEAYPESEHLKEALERHGS